MSANNLWFALLGILNFTKLINKPNWYATAADLALLASQALTVQTKLQQRRECFTKFFNHKVFYLHEKDLWSVSINANLTLKVVLNHNCYQSVLVVCGFHIVPAFIKKIKNGRLFNFRVGSHLDYNIYVYKYDKFINCNSPTFCHTPILHMFTFVQNAYNLSLPCRYPWHVHIHTNDFIGYS